MNDLEVPKIDRPPAVIASTATPLRVGEWIEINAVRLDKTVSVTVRQADKDDRGALAALATRLPLRRTLELVLGTSVDDPDVVARYHQWSMDVLLASGVIYVDDGETSVAGGRLHPPERSARLRLAVLPPWRKGPLRGRYRVPPLPPEVERRLRAVSRASMSLVPPGRSFHLSLWAAASNGGSGFEAVGHALIREVERTGVPTVTTTTNDDSKSMALLQRLGFQQSGETPFPGMDDTSLIGWRYPGRIPR